jgi:hypothetical protein
MTIVNNMKRGKVVQPEKKKRPVPVAPVAEEPKKQRGRRSQQDSDKKK